MVIRRTDSGLHALPGGTDELGETMTETAVRETIEETGVTVEVTGLIGIYSDPAHVIAFSDGEVRQEFSLPGQAHERAPATERRVDRRPLGAARPTRRPRHPPVHPSIRLRIQHGYADRSRPYYT